MYLALNDIQSLICHKNPTNELTNQMVYGGGPRDVMVKAIDCGIVVRKFVLQSRYYVHFRANTLGNGMKLLILPAMG